MTPGALVLLALTLVVAVGDWLAVANRSKPLEYVCKPATMGMLILFTLAIEPDDPAARAWFVAALAFGHLGYVFGMLAAGVSSGGLIVGVVVVLVSVATLGRHIFRGVQRSQPGLVGPVAAYIGVISAMVVVAFGRLAPAAIVGSLLFYASDALIAFNRFLDARPWMPVTIMVTYHLGQIGLVLSLV